MSHKPTGASHQQRSVQTAGFLTTKAQFKVMGRDFAGKRGFAKFADCHQTYLKRKLKRIVKYLIALGAMLFICIAAPESCNAQRTRKKKAEQKQMIQQSKTQPQQTAPVQPQGNFLEYIVEGNDTIFIDQIRAAKVFSRMPKMKGREWRKYYRLVHNFSKAYPYALVARKLVTEADSTIAADRLKGAKREKYISKVQKELFDVFEGQMRNLTVSQGALIMKLVDREIGKSSYDIIKGYKSGITAGFWQGIAKVFGSDLKAPYDPEGEDKAVEELVKIWEDGDFDALYWSLFWKDPPVLPIPEKYL